MPGLTICQQHTKNRKSTLAVAEKARQEQTIIAEVNRELTRMERFTALIPEDDPEARGDVALVFELRRTVNRIRIFDEWIQELGEGRLGWGRTSFEQKTMTGYPGEGQGDDSYELKRYEARANVFYQMQMAERVHLLAVSKTWISAGFKQRELDMQDYAVMQFNSALLALCEALGHDPADPAVRNTIHRVMQGLALQAIEA